MIYVQIKAGLGNQMFQYSFGRSLSLDRKEELALDTSWYGNQSSKDTIREFILGKYNIHAKIATTEELAPYNTRFKKLFRKVIRRFKYKKDNVYQPSEMKQHGNYFEGHWANRKYFEKYTDIIRQDLSLKNPLNQASSEVLGKIKIGTSVSVHVRRGDCVTNPHAANYQGTVDTSYYDEAYKLLIDKLSGNLNFYIFSDDIEWAKKNVLTYADATYVSKPEIPEYEELHLMSSCDHNIIANSTFSWWAAWLNPKSDKIVTAPKRWLKDTSFDTSDICPPEWIRI